MSFKCELCECAQPAKSKPTRVIVETRPRVYPERTRPGKQGNPSRVIDFGGEGYEIVREVNVCSRCVEGMMDVE